MVEKIKLVKEMIKVKNIKKQNVTKENNKVINYITLDKFLVKKAFTCATSAPITISSGT